MKLPARDAAFWSLFAVVLLPLAAVLAILVSFLLPFIPLDMSSLGGLPQGNWWLLGKAPFPAPATHPLWGLAGAAAALSLALPAALRAKAVYARTRAPEICFFLVFLFSLSTETLRAGVAVLYALDRSVSVGIVLTRVVYWGRFLGELSLLVIGLYALEMKFRNLLTPLGAALLIAFAVASNLPLDRTALLSSLVYKLGDEQGSGFVDFTLAVLTMGGGIGAFLTRRNRLYLGVAFSFLLLIAGRELLFAATSPLPVACGLGAFLGGVALFLNAGQSMTPGAEAGKASPG